MTSSDVKPGILNNLNELIKSSNDSNVSAFNIIHKLLYPAPYPPHYDIKSYPNQLFWIPAQSAPLSTNKRSNNDTDKPVYATLNTDVPGDRVLNQWRSSALTAPTSDPDQCNDIPCILVPHAGADILILHCHGNGCDIGSMYDTLVYYCYHLRAHVISFEYPGYGISMGKPTEQAFHSRARRTYDYITQQLKFPSSRIILFGNSIGTGVCCKLAADLNLRNIQLGAVVLQSAFVDIGNVVKHLGGAYIGAVASKLIDTKFDNLSNVQFINSPIMFIHGRKDSLIPYQQSELLYDRCASQEKHIVYINQATHNEWDLRTDVVKPLNQLINQYLRIPHINNTQSTDKLSYDIIIPDQHFITPQSIIHYTKYIEDQLIAKQQQKQRRQQLYASVTSRLTGLFHSSSTALGSAGLQQHSYRPEISAPISSHMHMSSIASSAIISAPIIKTSDITSPRTNPNLKQIHNNNNNTTETEHEIVNDKTDNAVNNHTGGQLNTSSIM